MSNPQEFEQAYWGDCCNTFDEDQKQFVYAVLMGLKVDHWKIVVPDNVHQVVDIGGGPTSMLLKTKRRITRGFVVDPLKVPEWVISRYKSRSIFYVNQTAETINTQGSSVDEVWIYNCLQHVEDPAKIIANAWALAPVLRIFEWVDVPPHDGHPHMLTKELLDQWIGQPGAVTRLYGTSGCLGLAYHGCFDRK